MLIEHQNKMISVKRQAELLGIARSTVYYEPRVDPYSLELMHLIDEQYTKTPFYGSRRIREILKRKGYLINRKRIQRLMRLMARLLTQENSLQDYPYFHKLWEEEEFFISSPVN